MMEFDAPLDDPLRNTSQITNDKQSQQKLKRPLNAYNLFYLERQPQMKAENPLLNGNEVSKLVAAEWKEMSEEKKKPYNENARSIYQEFKEKNPNYHYDKSQDKRQSKKKKANGIFDSPQNPYVETTNSLIQVGALTLAQFILSRDDVQTDIIIGLQSGKFISDIQQQPLQQQQQIVQPFDQSTHFDPLSAEME